jgi:hypothetical protein
MRKYAKQMAFLSDLLKRSPDRWEWIQTAVLAFRQLTMLFIDSLIHQHFNPVMPIFVKTDGSGIAIAGILKRCNGFSIPRLAIIYLRKCCFAGEN